LKIDLRWLLLVGVSIPHHQFGQVGIENNAAPLKINSTSYFTKFCGNLQPVTERFFSLYLPHNY